MIYKKDNSKAVFYVMFVSSWHVISNSSAAEKSLFLKKTFKKVKGQISHVSK